MALDPVDSRNVRPRFFSPRATIALNHHHIRVCVCVCFRIYTATFCRLLGVLLIAMPICMRETRAAVLLTRLARKMRKETGNEQYRARVEVDRASLRTLIYISCTRPICECGFAKLYALC